MNFPRWLCSRELYGKKSGAYAVLHKDEKSRYAKLDIHDGRIRLHALQDDNPPSQAALLPIGPLQNLLLVTERPEVFISLTFAQPSMESNSVLVDDNDHLDKVNKGIGGNPLGTFYISLKRKSRYAHQFLALCFGTFGPSYKHSRAWGILDKGTPGESIIFDGYLTECGRSQKALMSVHEDEGSAAMHEGMVFKQGSAGFLICTKYHPEECFSNPIGIVISGLDVLCKATQHEPSNEILISDIGLVVE